MGKGKLGTDTVSASLSEDAWRSASGKGLPSPLSAVAYSLPTTWLTQAVRWVVVLPGSFAGAGIAYVVLKLGVSLSFRQISGGYELGPFWQFIVECVGSFALGAVAVYAAQRIAPRYKSITAFSMAGLVLFLVGTTATLAAIHGLDKTIYIYEALCIAGAVAASIEAHRKHGLGE